MFRPKAFKELLGFDHTWLVIGYILIAGISFPFIFLYDDLSYYGRNSIINIPTGLIYATIIVVGNLYIFHASKPSVAFKEGKLQNDYIRQTLYHIIFTIIGSGLMAHFIVLTIPGGQINPVFLGRNIVGALLMTAIYVGFYESLYYMNALSKSIKTQEQLKRKNAESQLEILKNQVKPHFLFNSLNTLTSLIPEDPDLAVAYVQKLSKVYRYILEIKDKKLIPLQEELDCIKAYLYMLNIRFGDNLRFKIDEEGLNFQHHIVPLSLQLLVENAVKHNVISKKKPLFIKIHKGKNGHLLVCNNLQLKTQQMPSTGTGLDNIKSRYKILSNQEVDVIVTDKHFTVAIPLVKVA